MRFSAFALVLIASLPVAAQDPLLAPHPVPASMKFERNEVWAADLQAARDFADLLERAGEPDVSKAKAVTVQGDLSPDPGLVVLYPGMAGGLFGWYMPCEGDDVNVLCEDGVVRPIQTEKPKQNGRGSGFYLDFPRGVLPLSFEATTDWIVDGRRYRDTFRNERGVWRLAHWATWHARLGEDDRAVASWRAAADNLGLLPVEFPKATRSERFVLAALRSIFVDRHTSEIAAFRIFERIEALSHEPLEPEIRKEFATVAQNLQSRICAMREPVEADAESIRKQVVKRREDLKRGIEMAAAQREYRRLDLERQVAVAQKLELERLAWIAEGDFKPVEVASLTRSWQAEFWVRRLSSWKSASLASGSPGTFLDTLDRADASPCSALFDLGSHALPALVAGAAKAWPTDTQSDGQLLTVGDVCAFLIERITGEAPLPRAQGSLWPGRGIDERHRGVMLAAWWKEIEPLSMEDRWVVLWKRGSRPAVNALIQINARKHLPAIVDRVATETGRKRSVELQRVVGALREVPAEELHYLEDALPEACAAVVREALQ